MSAPGDLPTLRALHQGVLGTLAARYAERVQTIAAYDPFAADDDGAPRTLTTPALLLELAAIDPGPDDGTDRQPLRLSWTLHCVLSVLTEEVQVELREFAADVLACVRHNRWGYPLAVRAPQALSAQPGEFRPGLAGYDSWAVTWEQDAFLGPNAWAGGLAPAEVWIGFAPLVGDKDGTVDDYTRTDNAEVWP